MVSISKTMQALVKAQKVAELLKRHKEKESALRAPVSRPGRDESSDASVLSNLADFVSDVETVDRVKAKKQISLAQFRKNLKWLYDMIDDGKNRTKFRSTGNTFAAGRFYTFNYVPRHREKLELWDARPIILCLDARYATHFYKQRSARPNIGILAINWHYIPLRAKRSIMKQLIHDHAGNRARFINNRAIDVSSIEGLPGIYNALPSYDAIRQYLRAGRYSDKHGNSITAGAIGVKQIRFDVITEILEVPSAFEAGFVGSRPKGV